jgi:hypothetical protein
MGRYFKIGIKYKTSTEFGDFELSIWAESHLLAKVKATKKFNEIMPNGTLLGVY